MLTILGIFTAYKLVRIALAILAIDILVRGWKVIKKWLQDNKN